MMKTEQRDQPAALTDAQRFELLMTGVRDHAIYMLDMRGYVVSWNVGAQWLTGYTAAEIIGKHFSLFYADEDRAAGLPDRALHGALEVGKFEGEGWRIRKDGTHFWASVVIDPIRDTSGELVGFAKITRDISERKHAAEALDRANAALVQSQKMEAVGKLTGGVAHDFNNLLSVLANGLQVLTAQSRTHLDMKVLEMMQRAVDRGTSLTQQLLAFARQQPLKNETTNLNTLIREFEPMLRRAGIGSIRLEIALDSRRPIVLLDATRFESALLNLVVNARDAMPDGGVIVVGTEDVELGADAVGTLAAGPFIKVSVTDSGTGMSPAVASRAFEPFFTTKEVGKGTGLGLSQVYGFIKQSGGEVLIKSSDDKGTTIDIYLPAATGDAESVEDFPSRSAVETVLVVDDELDSLTAAAELFRNIGYDVVMASDAMAAIDVLKNRPGIEIVFSDVMMSGGVSGIELAHRIHQLYPAIRIVLASGFPPTALGRQYGDPGDFTFIHKPYRLAEVARALRS
jgi:PAS domain S-box-containing protein